MLSTATKVAVARALTSTLLGLGLRPEREIRRGGVRYRIDLREGIDLSLFLFGSFQPHVLGPLQRLLPPDAVAIDVGANIGAITLPIARHLARGRVFAFEPTDYAFAKLQANIALNPELATRITPIRSFVADTERAESGLTAYSSWPTVASSAPALHPVHKGVAKETRCGQVTLDGFVAARRLSALDFIKIDTDGHEFVVLKGAEQCLSQLRPLVVFEACEYLMQSPSATFEDFVALLASRRYTICDPKTLHPMTATAFRAACPHGGGLDLLALPDEKLDPGSQE